MGIVLLFIVAPVFGGSTWTNPLGGSFHNGANWNTPSPPGSGTYALFGVPSTYTVTFSSDVSNTQVVVTNELDASTGPHVTFDLNGHTYSLLGTNPSNPGLWLGAANTGADDVSLTVIDGRLTTNRFATIGRRSGTTAALTIGAGGSFEGDRAVVVGDVGTGTLNVTGGGQLSAMGMFVGYAPSGDGSVNVNQGTVSLSSDLRIARREDGSSVAPGSGSFTVNTGATVTVGGSTIVGNTISGGGTGTLAVHGGSFTTHNLTLASYPNATFDFTGGTVTVDGGTFTNNYPALWVNGPSAADTPTFRLTNGATTTLQGLRAGTTGHGAVEILSGSRMTTSGSYADVIIGYEVGSTGSVLVSGTDSQLIGEDNMYVGVRGAGALRIENGGAVTSNNGLVGGANTAATGEVTVSGAGSQWTINDALIVGRPGNGALDVQGGGRVNVDSYAVVGSGTGWTGQVSVSGDGSQLTSLDLTIGYKGTGSLTVEDGGVVTTNRYAGIGTSSTGVGAVTVAGPGAQWTVTDNLVVGASGSGTLDVQAGGRVNANSDAYVAIGTGSTGQVTVGGAGAQLDVGGSLYVSSSGASGTGSFTVNSGATVTVGGSTIVGNTSSGGTSTLAVHGGSFTTHDLTLADYPNATFDFTGGTVTVDGGTFTNNYPALWVNGPSAADTPTFRLTNGATTTLQGLRAGTTGHGAVEILSGSSMTTSGSSANVYIGCEVGSTGSVLVSGTHSQLIGEDNTYVGVQGAGTLRIENGGAVTSNYGVVGGLNTDATGEVTVSGAGSQWTINGALIVGRTGTGTLDVQGGGRVNVDSYAVVDSGTGCTGQVTVSGAGSQLTSQYLTIGYRGTGSLTVEDGGVVTTNGYAGIGTSSTGVGAVTVAGPGAQWTIIDPLVVGPSGSGTLDVQAGGWVNANSDACVAIATGSTGQVTVGGAGAQLDVGGSLYVGSSGASGTGSFTVNSGATVTVGGSTIVGNTSSGGTGTLAVHGGSFTTHNLTLASHPNATFDFTGGTVTVDGGTFTNNYPGLWVDGPSASNTPTFRLTNGATATLDYLAAGRTGRGAVEILSGSHLTSGYVNVGDSPGSAGSVLVSGANSHLTAQGSTWVGLRGCGTLTIENGATVETTGPYAGLGIWDTGKGTARVTGPGSQWTVDGPLIVGERGGDATLEVQAGGRVVANSSVVVGAAYLGIGGATGQVTVEGSGSRLEASGNLIIGSAQGTLSVQGGGVVTADGTAFVGISPGSSGEVTVAGNSSELNVAQSLVVGSSGAGTLNVENGGKVTSRSGKIAFGIGSTGEASVAGNASRWEIAESLNVGDGGSGKLTVANNGRVSVGDTVAVAHGSSVDVLAGMLAATTINNAGTFTNEGTVTGAFHNLDGGLLQGSGTIDGLLAIAEGSTLSPGDSPGTIFSTDGLISGGGNLLFEINDPIGTAGGDPGWDLWSTSDQLTIAATEADPFSIQLTSLQPDNTSGLLDGFDAASPYEWTFVTAGEILGFDPNAFLVDTSGFWNDLGGGWFDVVGYDHELRLRFNSVVPEPSSLAVWGLIGLAAAAVGWWRRRRPPRATA